MTNASATLLGILNDVFVTYQYNKNGQVLPQGSPQARTFVERSYSGYVGDAWRVSRELTINYGLRYENFRPPYETNGLQVDPTVPPQPVPGGAQWPAIAGRPGEPDAELHAQLRAERTRERQAELVESQQQGFRSALRPGVRSHRPRLA